MGNNLTDGLFDFDHDGKTDFFEQAAEYQLYHRTFTDSSATKDIDCDDLDDYDSSYTASTGDYTPAPSHSRLTDLSGHSARTPGKSSMRFQGEFNRNMYSAEAGRRKDLQRKNDLVTLRAENTMCKIRRYLTQSAKSEKDATVISCICPADQQFMLLRREDNLDKLRQNNQKFFLFRDPTLIYRSWDTFQINPKYRVEFQQYMEALRQMAAKEQIRVKCVVYERDADQVYSFPDKVLHVPAPNYELSIRATTNATAAFQAPGASKQTTGASQQTTCASQAELDHAKPRDSIGIIILKSLLVIAIVLGACVLCLICKMGELGRYLLLSIAVIISYYILKK